MGRLGLVVAFGLLLLCSPLADGGPVAQIKPARGRFAAHERRNVGQFLFKGGERACVIALGDHTPIVDIILEVRDEEDQVVARYDRGGDIVAAIWYPPQDGRYTIFVQNTGTVHNDIYIAVK
jgi:hypothetical protein